MAPLKDIICFANDWSGDPLSKKHLMLQFARKHRILWVNSLNNRSPQLKTKDFKRVLEKLKGFGKGLQHVEESIWVLTPLYVPFHRLKAVRSLNRLLLRSQIKRALRRLKFDEPTTWTFVPTSADVVGTLGESQIVYHCVDEYAAFSDAASEVAARERELMQKSDMVLVSASDLMTKKREFNPRTYMLRHGVDIENFRRAADPQTAISEQISKLPRPILGFHGLIADWVDLELIAKVARLRPEWSIVLIGKADTSLAPLDGLANVHLLGHCAYNKLPESLRGFDVAILPFVNNELTRAANPLKLREYLAAGLPVIAVPIPEVKVFEGEVLLADTAEEYVAHVEKLWAAGQTGPSTVRSDSMKNESWAGRAQEAERLLLQVGQDGTGRQDAGS